MEKDYICIYSKLQLRQVCEIFDSYIYVCKPVLLRNAY